MFLFFLKFWLSVFWLQVFVEFENASQKCSWVQVYGESVKAVLVEDSIVWANRSDTGNTGASASNTAWPALVSVLSERFFFYIYIHLNFKIKHWPNGGRLSVLWVSLRTLPTTWRVKVCPKSNQVITRSKGKFTHRLNLTHLLILSMSMNALVIFSNLRCHFLVSWGEKKKNRQTKT